MVNVLWKPFFCEHFVTSKNVVLEKIAKLLHAFETQKEICWGEKTQHLSLKA